MKAFNSVCPRFLLSFGAESTDSGATAPVVKPAECGLDCPREPSDLGWDIPSFWPCQFPSLAGVWPAELNLFFPSFQWSEGPEGGVLPGGLQQPEGKRDFLSSAQQRLPGLGQQAFPLLYLPSPVQAFCLMWAFLQNSVQELCLLGVIRCDLEKSVDHSLKTDRNR